jgi:outer membrane protein assembly factor BamB
VRSLGFSLVLLAAQAGPAPAPATLGAGDLAGAWAGMATHGGESTPYALELEPGADGKLLVKATVPAAHVEHAPLGRIAPEVRGREIRLGPFAFTYDSVAQTLTGVVPEGLAPVYRLPLVLHRVERVETPPRPALGEALVRPAWSFDAGSPLWAGPTVAGDLVLVGADDGRLHAVEAASGRERWSFRAGGPIRTRPAVAGSAVVFQADDGFLYALRTVSGAQAWRVRLVSTPIARLPLDDSKSRWDYAGSDVTVVSGRLYVGTHDGHVVALDAADGRRLWDFATGDSVLAAPSVDAGRVYVGSYDKAVYALDAASGAQLWKRDTQGAVVSTPTVAADLLLVGNRSYDIFGIRAATGEVAWKRYLFFSWIESTATVKGAVAYVGSSDAALVQALDVGTGRPRWQTDVHGWAWGQPAVGDTRVYVATASQVGYPSGHGAGVLALDRESGRVVWRYESAPAATGAFGFPGSPALGRGHVFVAGLDGRLYAFEP